MPYLSLEFDAIDKLPETARASGLREGDILLGLVRMWRWCFRERLDRITPGQLVGFFGELPDRATAALSDFGFVELVGGKYRVRGALRYLRIKERQIAAAKATNTKRAKRTVKRRKTVGGASGGADGTPHGTPKNKDGTPTAGPHGQGPKSDGLTANSDQPTASSKRSSASGGRATWITPYIEVYGEILNRRRAERGQVALEGDDLAGGTDIAALCQYLSKRKPAMDAWRKRVEQWLGDAFQDGKGLTRGRDFAGWHQRQIRKPSDLGTSDAERAMEGED